MNPNDVQLPPAIAYWIGTMLWILIALAALWVVLAVLGYLKRRAYNLSSVETAVGKEIKPDFLKVDHQARREQIERGDTFGEKPAPESMAASKTLSFTRIVGTATAVASFIAAVISAFMNIEGAEAAWRKYSAWDRLETIIQVYPVGFAVALLFILAAFLRMFWTLRRVH